MMQYVYDTKHDKLQEGVKLGYVKLGETDASPGATVVSANGSFPEYMRVRSRRHGNNIITIRISDISETIHLAHELCHAIYHDENLKEYIDWLMANPDQQGKGGHGKGDPSGKAAEKAEQKFR